MKTREVARILATGTPEGLADNQHWWDTLTRSCLELYDCLPDNPYVGFEKPLGVTTRDPRQPVRREDLASYDPLEGAKVEGPYNIRPEYNPYVGRFRSVYYCCVCEEKIKLSSPHGGLCMSCYGKHQKRIEADCVRRQKQAKQNAHQNLRAELRNSVPWWQWYLAVLLAKPAMLGCELKLHSWLTSPEHYRVCRYCHKRQVYHPPGWEDVGWSVEDDPDLQYCLSELEKLGAT